MLKAYEEYIDLVLHLKTEELDEAAEARMRTLEAP